MDVEKNYLELMNTLVHVAEANAGQQVGSDDRILDGEGLAQKFLAHALSALYLYRATTIPELRASFFDAASANVLVRAALETFLAFHHVYHEPQTPAEQDGRYTSWVVAGLLDRQHFPPISADAKRIHESDRSRIEVLRTRLQESEYFRGLTKKQQGLVMRGRWRLRSWYDIARSAGLNEIHARSFYSYVCGYAHSGNLSVSQIRLAQTAAGQRSLFTGSMGEVLVAAANMIHAYCTVFPNALAALAARPSGMHLVEIWMAVGQHGPEDVEWDVDEPGF